MTAFWSLSNGDQWTFKKVRAILFPMTIFTQLFWFLVASLLFTISCTSAPKDTAPAKETYSQCISRYDEIRKRRFAEIPEKFRVPFAGYQQVVKYYSSTPSIAQMKKDVNRLEKENNVFDARKDAASKDFEARLLDTSPGRNRILFSFERHRNYRFGKNSDVTLLRADYSKPEISYTCPIENFGDNGTSLTCYQKGVITAAKGLDGRPLSFKYDMKMRLVPINEKYFYFEWHSTGDKLDPDHSADHYFLRTLVFSGSEDRFFKTEAPYLDPAGELNPELCAELEGR